MTLEPNDDPYHHERPDISLKPLLWFFLGMVLLISPFYFLHRNSFCIDQWRFVPDSEAIDAAVTKEVMNLNGRGTISGRKFIAFKDKQEFLSLYPNCCKILRGDEERKAYNFMGLFSVISGYFGSAVEVKYMLQIADAEGRFVESPATITMIVSSCGQAGLGENVFGNYQIPD